MGRVLTTQGNGDTHEEAEDITSSGEVLIALKTMKNYKAPGPEKIPVELIKNAPGHVFQILVKSFTVS